MSLKKNKPQSPINRLKEELGAKLNAVVDKVAAEQGVTREQVIQFAKDFLNAHRPRK